MGRHQVLTLRLEYDAWALSVRTFTLELEYRHGVLDALHDLSGTVDSLDLVDGQEVMGVPPVALGYLVFSMMYFCTAASGRCGSESRPRWPQNTRPSTLPVLCRVPEHGLVVHGASQVLEEALHALGRYLRRSIGYLVSSFSG